MPQEINALQIATEVISSSIIIAGISADIFFIAKRHNRIGWLRSLVRLKTRPFREYDAIYLLLVLAIFFCITILTGKLIRFFSGGDFSGCAARLFTLLATLSMHLVTILTIERLRRQNKATYTDCFGVAGNHSAKFIRQGLIYYLAVMPPIMIVAWSILGLTQHFNLPLEPQAVLQDFASIDEPLAIRVSLILLAVSVGPIMEEIVFRGILLPALAKFVSPGVAIFTVSMIFALIHGNLQAMAPLAMLSIGLSLAYIRTGSIIVPIVMHAVFNAVNLTLYTLANQ